ncbi:MAG: bifunctional oligoribonuclease/PAP phosphatase NrnA [Desulfovibrionaceae bacterium]|nr:bifunctional oligoribonuclease/PAP phosphatase NrnA [Desulfovibrionaceae bacterium]
MSHTDSPAFHAAHIAEVLRQHDNILIAAHASPDGDAVGSMCAMESLLKSLGKRTMLYNATGIPDYLTWITEHTTVYDDIEHLPFQPELIVALDCGDPQRLGKNFQPLLPACEICNIDHHLANPQFGTVGNWIDSHMAATGQMVAMIAEAAGIPLIGRLAECVYIALVTDTGSFAHSNTTPEVFELAAKLLRNGLNAPALRDRLDMQWSMRKNRLWGFLMSRITLEANGELACIAVSAATLAHFEASREDLEGFCEHLRKIRGVRAALLLREDTNHLTKISMRSAGAVDVRSIASQFGGGGHFNAAGATVCEPMPKVRDKALKLLKEILEKTALTHP